MLIGAEIETFVMPLTVPLSGYGRVWAALRLRRPWQGVDANADDHTAVARSAGLPIAVAYDLAPDDLAKAASWARGSRLEAR